jgi:hypothetical protein
MIIFRENAIVELNFSVFQKLMHWKVHHDFCVVCLCSFNSYEMYLNAKSYMNECESYMRPLVERRYNHSWALYENFPFIFLH